MRGQLLRDGPTSNRPRVRGVAVLAIAGIWLGSALGAPARATAVCPNAQFRGVASEHLPDCRAYEQVSPVEKDGQDAVSLQPLKPAQSAPCEAGEACTLAYMTVGAAYGGAQGNELPDAYLAARGPDGWQTTPVSPPTLQAPANSNVKVSYAFSEDLSQTLLRVPFQQLTEGAAAGVYNLFMRNASGDYSLVTTTAPPEPPSLGCGNCFESEDVPAFAGASSNFGHVIFEANESLAPGAPASGTENLYEETGGRVSLVGILPDGGIPPLGATAGGGIEAVEERAHELERAVSQNGSQILFEAAADGGAPDPQQRGMTELYDRIDGSSTVEVSAPAPGARSGECEPIQHVCNAEPAQFWTASADGAFVYFTSKAALTRQSFTGVEASEPNPPENPGNDLYRYSVATGELTDLTADTKDVDGADIQGVVGSSQDGSYVYFVADGELAIGAESGKPNLYVWHETAEGSSIAFIATLAAPNEEEAENVEALRLGSAFEYSSDVEDWSSRPTASQAYVTPDGRHLAFMSVEPLTGYDNDDSEDGEPDHEVFEYSAETGRLACASCDPSGAHPLGSAFLGAKLSERISTPFHQPRSLSDDGSRLFFTSPDPLVSGISGGSEKVFEFEEGTPLLISGAEGGDSSVFLDASASGNDVFFGTREQLAPTDMDGLVDVYDARVGGGIAAPVGSMPCQGNACRETLGPPPSFSVPVSASFSGGGNLAPPPPPTKLTRKQLLTRALARCRKRRSRRARSVCVAAADRRYAPGKGRRGDGATRRSRG
jgi:WD40-like Beta Propeller Repeat